MHDVYEQLRSLMIRSAVPMLVRRDEPEAIDLDAPWPNPTKPAQPMWFGSVRRGKRYVSVHVMALYTHAELLASVPPELANRMQGKTCFNFTKIDPRQFEALEALITTAAALYAEEPAVRYPGAAA